MKRFLWISALLLIAAWLGGCGNGNHGPNPSGTLEATEVDLASTLAGRMIEVRPKLGDMVRKGDTLIVLDVELLKLQRAQNDANRRSLQAQRRVTEDQLQQAQRNLDLAVSTFKRLEAMLAQGSATAQQIDEAHTKRDVAQTQVYTVRHQLDALAAEDAKLDALLALNDRQIKDGVIVAPSQGTIILRNAEPGEVAVSGAVLLRLADLQDLELRVYLAETELSRVKIGAELPVLIDALKGGTLNGRVTWVSPESEFTPKNVQTKEARTQLVYAVKLSVPNPDGKLHIGMPAEVKL